MNRTNAFLLAAMLLCALPGTAQVTDAVVQVDGLH